jgi:hypothetical protein
VNVDKLFGALAEKYWLLSDSLYYFLRTNKKIKTEK